MLLLPSFRFLLLVSFLQEDDSNVWNPTKVKFFAGEKVSQVAFGAQHSFAITG
jgi:hypothetical protein